MNEEGATQFLPGEDSHRSHLVWMEQQSLRVQGPAMGSAQATFGSHKGIDESRYGYVTVDSCGDQSVSDIGEGEEHDELNPTSQWR